MHSDVRLHSRWHALANEDPRSLSRASRTSGGGRDGDEKFGKQGKSSKVLSWSCGRGES